MINFSCWRWKNLPQEWLVEMIGLELKKNFPQEWLVKMITRKAWIAFLEAEWLIILEGHDCSFDVNNCDLSINDIYSAFWAL